MYDGAHFEIDEFLGDNAGLIVAEVELPSIDANYPRPDWLGVEVSELGRYYNVNLIDRPYALWSAAEREGKEDVSC
jgi:adenylate cyclase